MTNNPSTEISWRLSSSEGLIEAGVVESCYFNPMTGLLEVAYTKNWARILRSGRALISDPIFGMALLDDDPAAMRKFVETEGSRLATEAQSDDAKARKGRPGSEAER
jgi:hypothetical protein